MVLPESGHLEKCRYFQTNGGLPFTNTDTCLVTRGDSAILASGVTLSSHLEISLFSRVVDFNPSINQILGAFLTNIPPSNQHPLSRWCFEGLCVVFVRFLSAFGLDRFSGGVWFSVRSLLLVCDVGAWSFIFPKATIPSVGGHFVACCCVISPIQTKSKIPTCNLSSRDAVAKGAFPKKIVRRVLWPKRAFFCLIYLWHDSATKFSDT
jgi:hypothetical protein